jgi:A/G-specific adenine glycosylase
MTKARFKALIWGYYRKEGRSMPWRKTRDPYAILVSEVMLQQTQVARVEGFYEKFLKQFPDFRSLAAAKTKDVLKAWQGLGYNRRALSLKRAAEIIVRDFGGKLPRGRAALESLPGIGKGTSGSLLAFAFNEPEIFIETNVRRIFIHFFFPKAEKVTDAEIERYIERTMDVKNPREWYWALMDYGAFLSASAGTNSNRRSAHYKKQSVFAGSDRELRGKMLRCMLKEKKRVTFRSLIKILQIPRARVEKIAKGLAREGFIVKKENYICIK